MKCPKCGEMGKASETRLTHGVFLRRARECPNGHRFTTYEVHAGNLDRRTLLATKRGISASTLAWQRREAVRSHTGSTSAVARELGITEARVRQIRAK